MEVVHRTDLVEEEDRRANGVADFSSFVLYHDHGFLLGCHVSAQVRAHARGRPTDVDWRRFSLHDQIWSQLPCSSLSTMTVSDSRLVAPPVVWVHVAQRWACHRRVCKEGS
jgi:hypothetical protein